jgi:hypothetical protein
MSLEDAYETFNAKDVEETKEGVEQASRGLS